MINLLKTNHENIALCHKEMEESNEICNKIILKTEPKASVMQFPYYSITPNKAVSTDDDSPCSLGDITFNITSKEQLSPDLTNHEQINKVCAVRYINTKIISNQPTENACRINQVYENSYPSGCTAINNLNLELTERTVNSRII